MDTETDDQQATRRKRDVISAESLPEPTYTGPSVLDIVRTTHVWELGLGAPITEGELPATGTRVVIDELAAPGIAVYRFPDQAARDKGSEMVAILHLLRHAKDGTNPTRAYTRLIDPETGDTSAQMAIMENRHADGRIIFNVADNRGEGELQPFSGLDRATAWYAGALDAHAGECKDVEPYGEIARLSAQQAAYRARLDYTNDRLAELKQDLSARASCPFTDDVLARAWGLRRTDDLRNGTFPVDYRHQ